MAAATSTYLAIAAIAAATAGTAVQVNQSRRANADAKDLAYQQDQQQKKMEADLRNKQINDKSNEAQAIMRIRNQSAALDASVTKAPRTTGTALGMSAVNRKTVLGG